jgi:hypothetical protein
MQKRRKGPRNNGVLEGITFNKNYRTLYTSIEEPLYEDTARLLTKGGLDTPISFDVKSEKQSAICL